MWFLNTFVTIAVVAQIALIVGWLQRVDLPRAMLAGPTALMSFTIVFAGITAVRWTAGAGANEALWTISVVAENAAAFTLAFAAIGCLTSVPLPSYDRRARKLTLGKLAPILIAGAVGVLLVGFSDTATTRPVVAFTLLTAASVIGFARSAGATRNVRSEAVVVATFTATGVIAGAVWTAIQVMTAEFARLVLGQVGRYYLGNPSEVATAQVSDLPVLIALTTITALICWRLATRRAAPDDRKLQVALLCSALLATPVSALIFEAFTRPAYATAVRSTHRSITPPGAMRGAPPVAGRTAIAVEMNGTTFGRRTKVVGHLGRFDTHLVLDENWRLLGIADSLVPPSSNEPVLLLLDRAEPAGRVTETARSLLVVGTQYLEFGLRGIADGEPVTIPVTSAYRSSGPRLTVSAQGLTLERPWRIDSPSRTHTWQVDQPTEIRSIWAQARRAAEVGKPAVSGELLERSWVHFEWESLGNELRHLGESAHDRTLVIRLAPDVPFDAIGWIYDAMPQEPHNRFDIVYLVD